MSLRHPCESKWNERPTCAALLTIFPKHVKDGSESRLQHKTPQSPPTSFCSFSFTPVLQFCSLPHPIPLSIHHITKPSFKMVSKDKGTLSERERELLGLAFECMKTKPEVSNLQRLFERSLNNTSADRLRQARHQSQSQGRQIRPRLPGPDLEEAHGRERQ